MSHFEAIYTDCRRQTRMRRTSEWPSMLEGKMDRGLEILDTYWTRYVVISTGSILQPPSRITKGELSYHTMKIGDNVFIGM